jgi:hypothetical protein
VFDVLERRSLPRRSLNPQPSTINIFQLQNPLPQTARHFSLSASNGERAGVRCRKQLLVNTADERGLTLINFRRTLVASEKPKRPEPKFNQNHFAQLRLLSLTKNSCKLAVKAEIDCTLKL